MRKLHTNVVMREEYVITVDLLIQRMVKWALLLPLSFVTYLFTTAVLMSIGIVLLFYLAGIFHVYKLYSFIPFLSTSAYGIDDAFMLWFCFATFVVMIICNFLAVTFNVSLENFYIKSVKYITLGIISAYVFLIIIAFFSSTGFLNIGFYCIGLLVSLMLLWWWLIAYKIYVFVESVIYEN
jgi:hypothetical protein